MSTFCIIRAIIDWEKILVNKLADSLLNTLHVSSSGVISADKPWRNVMKYLETNVNCYQSSSDLYSENSDFIITQFSQTVNSVNTVYIIYKFLCWVL